MSNFVRIGFMALTPSPIGPNVPILATNKAESMNEALVREIDNIVECAKKQLQ